MQPDTQPAEDARFAKLEHDLAKARQAQPLKAGVAALAGGIIASGAALGGFMSAFMGEISRVANKIGISFLEVRNNKELSARLGAAAMSNPESLQRLMPYIKAGVAAPFVGAVIGAWAETASTSKKIHKKRVALDALRTEKAQTENWQQKIDEEKTDSKSSELSASL